MTTESNFHIDALEADQCRIKADWDIAAPDAEPLATHTLTLCQQLGDLTIKHFGPRVVDLVPVSIAAMEAGISLDRRYWSHLDIEADNGGAPGIDTGYSFTVTPSDAIVPEHYLSGHIDLLSTLMYRAGQLLAGNYFELMAPNLVGALWVFPPVVKIHSKDAFITRSSLLMRIKRVLPDGTAQYREIREDHLSDFLKDMIQPSAPLSVTVTEIPTDEGAAMRHFLDWSRMKNTEGPAVE